jgi:hypothetical protein
MKKVILVVSGGLSIQIGLRYPHLRGIIMDLPPVCKSQGVLLISECVLNDDYSGSLFGVLMSLHLLVVCEPGARERSERGYRFFLAETGFLHVEVIRLEAPPRSYHCPKALNLPPLCER